MTDAAAKRGRMPGGQEGAAAVRAAGPEGDGQGWPLWARTALLLAGVAGALILLLWLARKPVAAAVASNWCAERGLECDVAFATLGPGGAVLGKSDARLGEAVRLDLERAEIALDWDGATPRVSAIAVSGAELSATPDGLTALGEVLGDGDDSGQNDAALPRITVERSGVTLRTEAGDVRAAIGAELSPDLSGTVTLRADPARLQRGGAILELERGEALMTLDEGAPSGRIALDLPLLSSNGAEARGLVVEADIGADSGSGREGRARLDADRIDAFGARADALRVEAGFGIGRLDGLPASFSDAAALVRELEIELQSGPAGWRDYQAASLQAAAHLSPQNGGGLKGPASLSLSGLQTPQGRAERAEWSGQAALAPELERYALSGGLGLEGAGLAPDLADALAGAISLPEPFEAHGRTARNAFDRAVQGFALDVPELDVSLNGERLEAEAGGALALEAASGLILRAGREEGPSLSYQTDGGLSFSGPLALSGGGAPTLSAEAVTLATEPVTALSARGVRLAPWRAEGLSAGLDASRIQYEGGPAPAAVFEGRVRLDGAAFGLDIDRLAASLRIQVRREAGEAGGWAVRTLDGACLSIEAESLLSGTRGAGPLALSVCPEGGRLTGPDTVFALGDIDLPLLGLPLESVALDGAEVRLGAQTALAADGVRFALPVSEDAPPLDVSLGPAEARYGDGALALSASGVSAGGGGLPAKLSGAAVGARLGLADMDNGLDGSVSVEGARIVSTDPDPLFEPLLAGLELDLDDGRLEGAGSARLARGGTVLAGYDVGGTADPLGLTVRVRTGTLAFNRFFQPSHISDRLRGLINGASGNASAEAVLRAGSGGLDASGRLILDGFSFLTTAFGPVERVTGTIAFSDLLALETPPGQTLRIGTVNPGLAFEDGRIVFQLLGGGAARLEGASFPFGGGVLSIAPTPWEPNAETRYLTLTANGLELEEITELFGTKDIEARGTVSGQFPVEVNRSGIFLRRASLSADGNGVIRYKGEAGSAAAGANEQAKLAFDLLRDFQFRVLEVEADGNVAGRLFVTMRMEGRNPAVLSGAPVNFNVGVDSELAKLVTSLRRAVTGEATLDLVAEARRDAEAEAEAEAEAAGGERP